MVQQWNQSDLAFLRERARLVNAELWVEGSTLHFKSRPQRSAAAMTLVAGNQLLYPLNPERMDVFRRKGRAWDDAPKRNLGPHDGVARAGTRR